MGQGFSRRANSSDGSIVLHTLWPDEGYDAEGAFAVRVSRGHEACARQIIVARLGADADEHSGGVRNRALQSITDELEQPTAPLEDLHDNGQVRRPQTIEEGRGALNEQATLRSTAQ